VWRREEPLPPIVGVLVMLPIIRGYHSVPLYRVIIDDC